MGPFPTNNSDPGSRVGNANTPRLDQVYQMKAATTRMGNPRDVRYLLLVKQGDMLGTSTNSPP